MSIEFRRVILVSMVAFLFHCQTALANQAMTEQWLDLWTKCRIAIETGKALQVEGLSQMDDLPKSQIAHVKRVTNWRLFGIKSGRFALLEREYQGGQGVLRDCDIILASDAAPLTPQEQALVVRTFLIERSKLIAKRTHEVRNPNPIFPIVPLGVGPVKLNPNGCSVISYLSFEP